MKSAATFFEEISLIPRPSGHEEKIADYLCAFATAHSYAFDRDAMHNVIIFRPASPGRAGDKAVLLQGHTDMVAEKEEASPHDFMRDPIKIVKEGDIWRADGTTLGADNGTAVALILALLDDPALDAPALECVFTSQEETGLFGAAALDTSTLRAAYMLNLDCGPEGKFATSCAGGLRARVRRELADVPAEGKTYGLHVGGLLGGHSGGDIHYERGNALKLIGRALHLLRTECGARLVSVQGGSKDNVIPSYAQCVFAAQTDPTAAVAQLLEQYSAELAACDPGLTLTLSAAASPTMLDAATSDAIISLLFLAPCGVRHDSIAQPGLVETSLNIGVVSMEQGSFQMNMSVRSSVASRKWQLYEEIRLLGDLLGFACSYEGVYPGWAYAPQSPLRDAATALYSRMRGEEAQCYGIHGGLECGLFKEKMPHLDIIATGVTEGNVHSTQEWMSISSMERTHEYLIALLKELP